MQEFREFNFRDRVAIRQHIRQQMRQHGQLEFCDDAHEDLEALEQFASASRTWARDVSANYAKSLISEGLCASTTDHPLQSISNTLTPDQTDFWSSSGSESPDTDEALLFALESAACAVKFVRIAVYRAQYQHGDPLYPPRAVSFMVGPSPTQLYPASPVYTCRLTDGVQVFALDRTAPPAGFLLIRLHGKLQKQWEDAQYYTAIRYVSAHGDVLQAHEQPLLLRALSSYQLTWPATASAGPLPSGPQASGAASTSAAAANTAAGPLVPCLAGAVSLGGAAAVHNAPHVAAAGGHHAHGSDSEGSEGEEDEEGEGVALPPPPMQLRRRLPGFPRLARAARAVPPQRQGATTDTLMGQAGSTGGAAPSSTQGATSAPVKRESGEEGAGTGWRAQGPPSCALAWSTHALLLQAHPAAGRPAPAVAWGWRTERSTAVGARARIPPPPPTAAGSGSDAGAGMSTASGLPASSTTSGQGYGCEGELYVRAAGARASWSHTSTSSPPAPVGGSRTRPTALSLRGGPGGGARASSSTTGAPLSPGGSQRPSSSQLAAWASSTMRVLINTVLSRLRQAEPRDENAAFADAMAVRLEQHPDMLQDPFIAQQLLQMQDELQHVLPGPHAGAPVQQDVPGLGPGEGTHREEGMYGAAVGPAPHGAAMSMGGLEEGHGSGSGSGSGEGRGIGTGAGTAVAQPGGGGMASGSGPPAAVAAEDEAPPAVLRLQWALQGAAAYYALMEDVQAAGGAGVGEVPVGWGRSSLQRGGAGQGVSSGGGGGRTPEGPLSPGTRTGHVGWDDAQDERGAAAARGGARRTGVGAAASWAQPDPLFTWVQLSVGDGCGEAGGMGGDEVGACHWYVSDFDMEHLAWEAGHSVVAA